MRAIVYYRKNTDYARDALNFVEELKRRYPDKKIITKDVDTRDGYAEATLYDIVRYPSVVVSSDDGKVMNVWQGDPLPLQNEIISYMI